MQSLRRSRPEVSVDNVTPGSKQSHHDELGDICAENPDSARIHEDEQKISPVTTKSKFQKQATEIAGGNFARELLDQLEFDGDIHHNDLKSDPTPNEMTKALSMTMKLGKEKDLLRQSPNRRATEQNVAKRNQDLKQVAPSITSGEQFISPEASVKDSPRTQVINPKEQAILATLSEEGFNPPFPDQIIEESSDADASQKRIKSPFENAQK